MNKEAFSMSKFNSALTTLLFTWGSNAPAEAVWTFNELMLVVRDMTGLTINQLPDLDEDLSNWEHIEIILNRIEAGE